MQGLDSARPTALLPDGSVVQLAYQPAPGTHLIFADGADGCRLSHMSDVLLTAVTAASASAADAKAPSGRKQTATKKSS